MLKQLCMCTYKLVKLVSLFDRLMMIQIKEIPLNINIIEIYAPIPESFEEELKNRYAEWEQLNKLTKKHGINIIMGDMNANIGKGPNR